MYCAACAQEDHNNCSNDPKCSCCKRTPPTEEETVELLQSIVDDMVYPDGWINICRYCHVSWPNENDHYSDCVYVKAKDLLERRQAE